MGNKPQKERPARANHVVLSPQLPDKPIAGRNSTIKSILRKDPSKDSSSLSSTSSIAKQNVTFFDQSSNNVNFVPMVLNKNNYNIFLPQRPISPVSFKKTNNLSYSTETLKPSMNDGTSSVRSRESVSRIQITYADDYTFRKGNDEPFISDCELMPSYPATFLVRSRQPYHSTITLNKTHESQTVKTIKRHSRANITEEDVFRNRRPESANSLIYQPSNSFTVNDGNYVHNNNIRFNRL